MIPWFHGRLHEKTDFDILLSLKFKTNERDKLDLILYLLDISGKMPETVFHCVTLQRMHFLGNSSWDTVPSPLMAHISLKCWLAYNISLIKFGIQHLAIPFISKTIYPSMCIYSSKNQRGKEHHDFLLHGTCPIPEVRDQLPTEVPSSWCSRMGFYSTSATLHCLSMFLLLPEFHWELASYRGRKAGTWTVR